MNYSKIKWVDVANGTGMRMSVFVSGCTHACPQCFNEEAWDFDFGTPYTPEVQAEIIKRLGADYMRGLSLLGGEPLDPRNQAEVLSLVKQAKEHYPEKDIWCFTGYLFEELAQNKVGEHMAELLPFLDILVDGKFIASKKNLSLKFRGSENQRVIAVADSLQQNQTVIDHRFDLAP